MKKLGYLLSIVSFIYSIAPSPSFAAGPVFHSCLDSSTGITTFAVETSDLVTAGTKVEIKDISGSSIATVLSSDPEFFATPSYKFVLKLESNLFKDGAAYAISYVSDPSLTSFTTSFSVKGGVLNTTPGNGFLIDSGVCSLTRTGSPADPKTPNSPTSMGAKPVSSSIIKARWDDTSKDESDFSLEVSENNFVNVRIIGVKSSTPPDFTGVLSLDVTSLKSNTFYYFRVRAGKKDSAGKSNYSAYSNIATAKTLDDSSGSGGIGSGGGTSTISGPACDPSKSIRTSLGMVPTEPSCFVNWVIKTSLGIVGGLGFLRLLLGSLKYIDSKGNPESAQEAKAILTNAVFGILMVVFSTVILQIIGVDVLSIPGFTKSLNKLQLP